MFRVESHEQQDHLQRKSSAFAVNGHPKNGTVTKGRSTSSGEAKYEQPAKRPSTYGITTSAVSTTLSSANRILEREDEPIRRRGGVFDLARALNYGHAAGSQPLVRFLTEHVELVHNPPYRNWGVCMSAGSTSAMETALRMFCNRGDTILTERYTYPGMIEAARLVGVKLQGIDVDAEGLIPKSLQTTLCDWDHAHGSRPRVLYTIPCGQNPTGVTLSLQRKSRYTKSLRTTT